MTRGRQAASAAALVGGAATLLGFFTQLDHFVVSEAEFDKLEARLERHIEKSNENLRERRERWRSLGFDEPTPSAGTR